MDRDVNRSTRSGSSSRSQVFGHVAAGLGKAQLLVESTGAGVVGEDVQTDPGQRVVVAPALGGQHDRAAVALSAYVGFDGDVVDERGVVGDFDPEETDPAVAVVGVPEMVARGGE